MKVSLSVMVAVAALASSPATARDWPTAGGWVIAETAGGCGVTLEYEGAGETRLTILAGVDRSVTLVATNGNWSAERDRQYPVALLFDESVFQADAVGVEVSYRKGLAVELDASALDVFARSRSLKIMRDTVLVDSLQLNGSGAATAVLRRCLIHVTAVKAAEDREKARLAHIPKDPFALPPATGTAGLAATRPVPRGNPGSWVTQDDYPAAALREERRGTTIAKLAVGTDGRVAGCTVQESSGSPDLDDAFCKNVQRRARYSPAMDAGGRPTAGEIIMRHTWSPPAH